MILAEDEEMVLKGLSDTILHALDNKAGEAHAGRRAGKEDLFRKTECKINDPKGQGHD